MQYQEIKNKVERHPFLNGVIMFHTKTGMTCIKKDAITAVSVYKNKDGKGVAEISALGDVKVKYYFDNFSGKAVTDVVSYVFGV